FPRRLFPSTRSCGGFRSLLMAFHATQWPYAHGFGDDTLTRNRPQGSSPASIPRLLRYRGPATQDVLPPEEVCKAPWPVWYNAGQYLLQVHVILNATIPPCIFLQGDCIR